MSETKLTDKEQKMRDLFEETAQKLVFPPMLPNSVREKLCTPGDAQSRMMSDLMNTAMEAIIRIADDFPLLTFFKGPPELVEFLHKCFVVTDAVAVHNIEQSIIEAGQ